MPAVRGDVGEILTLQRACWVQEALANDMLDIPALHESLETVEASLDDWDYYVVRVAGRLVGAVRGRLQTHSGATVWDIGRVMVAPDLQGRGLGRVLLEHIQAVAPAAATSYSLFTGARSEDNLRMYKKAGFSLRRDLPAPEGAVLLTKTIASRLSRLRQTRPRPSRPKDRPETHPGDPRRAPATGGPRRRRPSRTEPLPEQAPPSDTAADLWHSRGALHEGNVIADLGSAVKRDDVPDFRAGDTIKVHVKVVEGNRSRVQVFQGVVIRIHGSGVGRTFFTVRKVSFGVGVERTFPIDEPNLRGSSRHPRRRAPGEALLPAQPARQGRQDQGTPRGLRRLRT